MNGGSPTALERLIILFSGALAYMFNPMLEKLFLNEERLKESNND